MKITFRIFYFILPLFFQLFFSLNSFSQRKKLPTVEIIHTGIKTSLRGLSVVNNNVIWVSGSNGMVGRSANAGKNWKWITVKGFEKTDFRDIVAFDANTAIIMGIAEPAYILKTENAGETWKVVFENKTKGMFLDAMDFQDIKNGVVVGDPIDGKFFIAKTTDGGNSWEQIAEDQRPKADEGEAFFAASGTNVRYLNNGSLVFVTGGKNSRVFYNYIPLETKMTKSKESSGAFSVAIFDNHKNSSANRMVIVGGDYTSDSSTKNNCYVSNTGGKSWIAPNTAPNGYRSCVEFLNKETLVTCGTNGVDYSFDGGKNWHSISKEGFHACRFARFGDQVYLTGNNGKIGKLVWGN